MGETLVPTCLSNISSILDALRRGGLAGSVLCLERGDRIVGRISLREGACCVSVRGEVGTSRSTGIEADNYTL